MTNYFFIDEVSERMLDRLSFIKINPQQILNVHTSRSSDDTALKRAFPQANVTSIVVQGIGNTHLPTHHFDLIFSVLALSDYEDTQGFFLRCQNLLKPEGLLFFSSLGPDTLSACRDLTWKNPIFFRDMHPMGDELLAQAWGDPVLEREVISLNYETETRLRDDIVTLGLPEFDWPAGTEDLVLTDSQYQLSFEVVYGHAWVGQKNRATANAEGVVYIPIESLKFPRQ